MVASLPGWPAICRPTGNPWAPNPQGTEIAGVLDRLKLLVRMKGNRDVVSLLVTTGSSCSSGATLPDVGITRTSYLSNASSTCCRSIVLNF